MADDPKLPSTDDTRGGELTRRRVIKLAVGAAVAVPLLDLGATPDAVAQTARAAAREGAATTFFTKPELALVDELAEMIIPTDEHSPGARAAGVAAFLDRRLAETWDSEDRVDFRAGLRAIDALSQKRTGKAFLAATPDERVALLTEISKNEFKPTTPEETFFRKMKEATAYAYYTSEIGIQKDINYKGNTYLDEFVGYDVSVEDAGGGETKQ